MSTSKYPDVISERDPRPSRRDADPHDPRPLRRRAGALALIASPAALLLSEVLYRGTDDPAQLVADAARSSGAIVLSNVALLVSSALLLPAAYAVLHLARDRGRRLALTGASLATLGALGHAAYVGFSTVVLSTPAGDRAEMVALLTRVNHGPGIAPIGLCILSFALSLPFLTFGAWRAGLVPLWGPVAVLVAVGLEIVGVPGVLGGVAKESLALVAMGAIGWRVLRLGDDAWGPAPTASGDVVARTVTTGR